MGDNFNTMFTMQAARAECLNVYATEDVVNCEKFLLQKQSY